MQTKVHSIARFLYTHNPFYPLSASLVLYGLHAAFGERTPIAGNAVPENVWLLAGSLCGYTLLLALTAYMVVRLGRVWEDARSLALLVILMFVAISVSFDEICNTLPSTASMVLSLGLIFSLLVSEGLIRSLEIKFPLCFLVATLISAFKGGFGKQLRRWFADAWQPLPHKFAEDTA